MKNDVLSGLTVALALVPEAVAFALIAGVEPLVGLYAAFMVGLITSIFGGRPGMISGATGAMAVVMVALVADHGVEYLFAAVVLTGLIQLLAGVLRIARFIRLVPHPVMLGFVNGLAIVIFLAQLSQFGEPGGTGWAAGTFLEGSILDVAWLPSAQLTVMLGLIALTMSIIHFLPKLTTAIPSSLVAILVVSLLVVGLQVDTKVVGDIASIAGGFPSFHIPSVPFSFETLTIILPYAVVLAAIGLIESLLTLRLIDEITETRGNGNRECLGQGLANTLTGLFGGMGGCAMIGQSMINVNSGGRGRLSGITAAISLLAFILFASSLIEQIPIAALVGVMFIVVIGTFEWSSFRIIRRVPRQDAFVLITVSAVTVFTDLAVAVIVGVIISALVFAWNHAKEVRVEKRENRYGSHYYTVHGPLFFGSTASFSEQFTPRDDNTDVIIDFADSRVVDHSGIEAIDALAMRYKKNNRTLHLIHLSRECKKLLKKAGDMVEVNVVEDPDYFVAIEDADWGDEPMVN
ncbi:sodium-independent anion transporter [Arenicella chitinivorans]|uniref:Sodium-independent anion transporter n=2 Tax=Arenicella chitinivorans TaxID=1329800 RepID=A0A918RRU6_9GAMM|nr:SulP family inorganic anion transporter [Arenicella chitinivorans]GHA07689.1 sodium-independent anion transporter [Arenicella chitinivorans]